MSNEYNEMRQLLNKIDEGRCNGISRTDFDKYAFEDKVNNPRHYTVGGYEAIDVIKAKLTPEEYRGACKANVLKYLMRANYKGHHDQDLEKALYYMKELVNALDSKEAKSPVHWTDAQQVREAGSDDPPF